MDSASRAGLWPQPGPSPCLPGDRSVPGRRCGRRGWGSAQSKASPGRLRSSRDSDRTPRSHTPPAAPLARRCLPGRWAGGWEATRLEMAHRGDVTAGQAWEEVHSIIASSTLICKKLLNCLHWTAGSGPIQPPSDSNSIRREITDSSYRTSFRGTINYSLKYRLCQ